MLTDDQLARLKHLLSTQFDWPSEYVFKFIVPREQTAKVEALFPKQAITLRDSRRGNYVSMTIHITLDSADIVIAIYQKASLIKGVISL